MKVNFRVVRRMVEGKERLAIHRAYYTHGQTDECPDSIDDLPVTAEGDDLPALLRQMQAAFGLPIIEFGTLPETGSPQDFLNAEEQRLMRGLNRKAQGMEHVLEELRRHHEPPRPEPRDCFIGFLRKQPGASFLVEFPDLPGCIAEGQTLENATHIAASVLSDHLRGMRQEGQILPKPSTAQALAFHPDRHSAPLLPVEARIIE